MRIPITQAILAVLIGIGGASASTRLASSTSTSTRTLNRTVLAPKNTFPHNHANVQWVEDYGSFALYKVDDELAAAWSDTLIQDDSDVLQFSSQPFDTQRDTLRIPAFFSLQANAPGLQIVQFIGPVKQEWLDALSLRGIKPVQYVANYGYIVWTDAEAHARLSDLRGQLHWLQFSAPFHSFLKVDSDLGARVAHASADEEVDVVVQIYRHETADATRAFVESKGVVSPNQLGPFGAGNPGHAWAPIMGFENLQLRVHVSDIPAIAARPDVTSVGAYRVPRMMDEKQGSILAGDFAPGPATPSYLQFLLDRGFSQIAGDYPIVDVTDSTINEGGTGGTVVNTADSMLHVQGNIVKPSRVAYFRNCSALGDEATGAVDGHGSLNGGIIAGYDQRSGYPFQDSDGQRLGLGINPFGRIGSTAIFVPIYNIDRCGGTDQGVILSNWQSGARISSNSWGVNANGVYTASAQIYDAGVRDANPAASGNQELIYLFSAGNAGPGAGSIGSPGTAKNVITVGASENLRPFAKPADSFCGTDPANDPQNVVDFSSRGPAQSGRSKPEMLAPGTHIQAGASNYIGYDGSGVCVQYFPQSPAQQIFTYSSGTSHSTPAVAAVASLAYWWIQHGGAGSAAASVVEVGGNRAPSPAMMKAWLIAHPSYLTGTGANDNLPSFAQGYGMPNMGDMFSDTPKWLIDQSETFGNSGEKREYTLSIVDPRKPVRVALAYTDAPGALAAGSLANDLDLEVIAGGNSYRGNTFTGRWSTNGGTSDRKNNYEAVFLPNGIPGDLTISVTATNIAADGVPNVGDETDQDFALVCSNCALLPTYTISTARSSPNVCVGADYSASIALESIENFAGPVDLDLTGAPAGTSQHIIPPRVTPPGSALLSIDGSNGVPAGHYPLQLTGLSGSIGKVLNIDLAYASEVPLPPGLAVPANGASNVELTPLLSWASADQAGSYFVEVARDARFSNVVAAAEVTATEWRLPSSLQSSTQYHWRVTAKNGCGDSSDALFSDGFQSASQTSTPGVFVFSTIALAGDCPAGAAPQTLFFDDMESGAPGWLRGGDANGNRWTLGVPAHSGTKAMLAKHNPFLAMAQDLVSPSINLPQGLSKISLSFWNQQSLQAINDAICFDGGVVDISTNGGINWTQITTGLLTDPYDGIVGFNTGNQLAGKQAWCGNPQAYLDSIVDLTPYAGQTVRLRFFFGDGSRNDITGPPPSDPAWAIDDVKVTGCAVN